MSKCSTLDTLVSFEVSKEEYKKLKNIREMENSTIKQVVIKRLSKNTGVDLEVIYYQEKIGKLLEKIQYLLSKGE